MNILISGGAGFIGSNLAKKLVRRGYNVTILDSISPQIHDNGINSYLVQQLPSEVNLIIGDVQNRVDWLKSLKNIDIVVHFAAETGTGQSMYQIEKYTNVNIGGTALLLDILTNEKHKVKKVIVASSRAIYGEGKYLNAKNEFLYPKERNEKEMKNGQFEPICEVTGEILKMTLTDEKSMIHPTSIYGITKQVQEQMVLTTCRSIGIDAIGFRYQNVYGVGQSLTNPYTGILSIFSGQLLNNQELNIFEDGQETRDFVNIEDVVDATMLGIEYSNPIVDTFNVGTGIASSVLDVAQMLKSNYRSEASINISGNYRIGDIRHNAADISKIKYILGFQPKVTLEQGIKEFCGWVVSHKPKKSDAFQNSLNEMSQKGLLK